MAFNLNKNKIIEHIDESIESAKNNISKLNSEILNLEGFSGIKTRHLYNNICNIDNINYLEIGTYLGSTLISSSFQNNIYSIGVDNWSEFEGPKNQCIANLQKYIPSHQYSLIEKDCFQISHEDLHNKPIDIYLYDGNHEYSSHINAITYLEKFLAEISIIIIDDFRGDGNWSSVTSGTMEGLKRSNLKILYSQIIESKQEENGKKDFWNGCGLFLCCKN